MANATIGTDLEYAISLLNKGELVAIPTETVYGLAGNACNPYAVAKIFHVKQRPSFNPVIVHISKVEHLGLWVSHIPDVAAKLADAFWPGPMTLLLPKSDRIPDLVTAGSEKVGIRIPSHPLTLELLHRLPFPLQPQVPILLGISVLPLPSTYFNNWVVISLIYWTEDPRGWD